jgi:hypothetical protein
MIIVAKVGVNNMWNWDIEHGVVLMKPNNADKFIELWDLPEITFYIE